LKIFERMPRSPESGLHLLLLQAIPNKERMELIIEKAVELGVDDIQPYFSERSYALSDLPQSKQRRWQERARKAADQSRRGKLTKVLQPVGLEQALKTCSGYDLKLVLFEGGSQCSLKKTVADAGGIKSCALAVGPEGGLSDNDIAAFRQAGFRPVSLGGRILRTETAAIIGVGILQFMLGEPD
jgi:16S rRNA (uracil1498-N3)-methyltransferase